MLSPFKIDILEILTFSEYIIARCFNECLHFLKCSSLSVFKFKNRLGLQYEVTKRHSRLHKLLTINKLL